MGAISIRLPQSLHQKLGELAEREGISINQLINAAVSEKMAALMTEEYLSARSKRGSRRKFKSSLAKVADIEAEDFDRLPKTAKRSTKRKTG